MLLGNRTYGLYDLLVPSAGNRFGTALDLSMLSTSLRNSSNKICRRMWWLRKRGRRRRWRRRRRRGGGGGGSEEKEEEEEEEGRGEQGRGE